ncbi:MAG: hypothetical protein ACRDYX_19995 [Egibacteraceae bacterium]
MGEQRRQARPIRPRPPEPEPEPSPPSAAPVAAVVNQWTGLQARALRIALRLPLNGFARLLNAGRTTVCDWEAAGDQLVLSWAMQDELDEVLSGASDDAKRRFGNLARGGPVVWVSDSVPLTGNGGDTDRGQFFKAGLVAAFAPLDVVERLMGTPVRVDGGYLDALERQTVGLYSEVGLPLRARLQHARPHLEEALGLLGGSMSPGDRQRLRVIAGASSQLVGGLARRAGLWGDAQRHHAAALALGREAGHIGVQAGALGGLAQLHLEAGRGPEHAKDAADYIDEAWSLAATGPVAAEARSWLAAARGLAKAASGDGDGLRAGIDDAYRVLGHEGPTGIGDRLVGPMTEACVERYLGEGLVRLGDAERAVAALRPVVDQARGGERTRRMVHLAEALALAREPEEACRLLGDGAEQAVTQGYWLGLRFVFAVRAGFPGEWAGLGCVQDLDERLLRLRLTPWLASA